MRFKSLLTYLIPLAIAGSMFLLPVSASAQPWKMPPDEEFLQLRQEIGSYLLVQELQLTADQKMKFRQKLEELAGPRKEIEKEIERFHGVEKEQLRALASKLKQGGKIDPANKDAFRKSMEEHWNAILPLKDRIDKEFDALLGTLSSDQMERLRNFNPMIPGPGMGMGPGRDLGCSGDPIDLLEDIRHAPEDFIQSFTERMEQRGNRRQGRGMQAKQKLLDLIKQVRSMSDSEFESQKGNLAANLNPAIMQKLQMRCQNQNNPGAKPCGNGPCDGTGPGMGMGMGMGPGFGMGRGMGQRFMHQAMVRMIMLSDTFYEALK